MSLFKKGLIDGERSCCDDGERDFEATVDVQGARYGSVSKNYTVHAQSREQAREIARRMFLEDMGHEARVRLNETTP